MPNISISTWASYLQSIHDDPQKLLAINRQGNIQLIDKQDPSKGFKRLTLDQIISLTLDIFENSNNLSRNDSLGIIKGLNAITIRRSAKYKELHSIRKFFAGEDAKKRIEEDKEKVSYITSLFHLGHTYTNRLLKDFEQEIPHGLAPEVIETTVVTLLKDPKITDVEANHSTLYKMCEEAANKYFEKNDIASAFRVRMLVAKQLSPTPVLKDMSKLDNHHFDSLDTGVLKNGSLHVKKMVIDGKPYTRLMFKVNPHERSRLDTTITKLQKESNRKEVLQLLPENFCTDLQVKSRNDGYYCLQSDNTFKSKDSYTLGTATEILFGDEGCIKIGADPDIYTHYNRVQIFIPADSGDIEKKAHTMLSAVGLGGVLFSQRQMDDERMKIFHLLRYFYPREARMFETNHRYFSISPYHLQLDIIEKIPAMKEVFMRYLVDQPELNQEKKGYKVSAGVIIKEPDGRYWLFEPKGHYGGYEHTFPKGRQEKGLTMQQTALKEAWEESGLHVQITGFLCDQTRGTTHTRYYLAQRLTGDPSDAHWEAEKVKLVPKGQLHKFLNKKYDQELLKQLRG